MATNTIKYQVESWSDNHNNYKVAFFDEDEYSWMRNHIEYMHKVGRFVKASEIKR